MTQTSKIILCKELSNIEDNVDVLSEEISKALTKSYKEIQDLNDKLKKATKTEKILKEEAAEKGEKIQSLQDENNDLQTKLNNSLYKDDIKDTLQKIRDEGFKEGYRNGKKDAETSYLENSDKEVSPAFRWMEDIKGQIGKKNLIKQREKDADEFNKTILQNDDFSQEQKDFLLTSFKSGYPMASLRKIANPNLEVLHMKGMLDEYIKEDA